jgi:hypothetical protein
MVPKISGLQEALPKAIGLLPFDGGVAGEMGIFLVNVRRKIAIMYQYVVLVGKDMSSLGTYCFN